MGNGNLDEIKQWEIKINILIVSSTFALNFFGPYSSAELPI